MEKHSVSKMIGAPPGYVGYEQGGNLTEIVRRKPFSVILMDEVEKAHPDTFNALLQIMEDGRLTDSKGRTVDFKNTILIMTSNVGSEVLRKEDIGFGKTDHKKTESDTDYKKRIDTLLKESFRPEFLNRIDEIVLFTSLTQKNIEVIAGMLVQKTAMLLKEQNIELEVDAKAIKYLAKEGYNDEYGARPLRRLIQREIDNKISSMFISKEIEPDSVISVAGSKSGLELTVKEPVKVK